MNHEEYKIHVAIVEHHISAFPYAKLMYVPNRVVDATEAFFNKKLGAQPGAHDLFIFWRKAIFKFIPWIGVAIFEVKSRTGKLSTAQNKFASGMSALGAHTGYGSSVKSYHEFLKSCGLKSEHDTIKEPDLRDWDEKKKDAYNFYAPVDKRKP